MYNDSLADIAHGFSWLPVSISKIKSYIHRLGFNFCGFENDNAKIEFLKNNKNNDLFDLEKWEEFEINNKDVFSEMYQFWIQKIKGNLSE